MRVFGDSLSSFMHWFGWTLALIASIVFIIFDIPDWLILLVKGNGINQVGFYIFLVIAIAGVIVSLFKRVAGGWLMLAGGIGMVGFYYTQSGWKEADMMVVYGLPYILPAFLLLTVKPNK
jgi:hypothetical protein